MAVEIGDLDGALARARSGDEAGFVELWRTLQPRLLRYLRVLSCEDPDDVASETWLQVVRDLHKFTGGADGFRGWLFSVGRHRAIDAARARKRRRASPVADDLDRLADEQMVEDQVLDGMSVAKAVGLLDALSRDQAEAVALRVIAGLETTAVADILGKSPGAVRVALHRGLRSLAADPRVRSLAADPRVRALAADPRVRALAADPRVRALAADPAPQSSAPGLPARGMTADPGLDQPEPGPQARSVTIEPDRDQPIPDPRLLTLRRWTK